MAYKKKSYKTTRPRRRFEWARSDGLTLFEESNQSGVSDLMAQFQSVLGADAAGVTVTRIRGEFTWAYTPQDPAGEGAWRTPVPMAVGIRVDENQLTNLSDTQGLQKLNQRYADWMYYNTPYVYPAAAFSETEQPIISENLILRQAIDIKAQRRFDELQQSLFLFAGNPGWLAGQTVRFSWNLNILLKMP